MPCSTCSKASYGEAGYTLQTGCLGLCNKGPDFLTPYDVDGGMIAALTGTVDSIRDLQTALGARPKIVRLIWTKWTGGKRGAGEEYVFREEMLTPMPKLSEISDLNREATQIGAVEVGNIEVTEISARYTEGLLLGLIDGKSAGPEVNFYWEIEHAAVSGGKIIRRRFFPAGPPTNEPDQFQWKIRLVRATGDRTPDALPRGVP